MSGKRKKNAEKSIQEWMADPKTRNQKIDVRAFAAVIGAPERWTRRRMQRAREAILQPRREGGQPLFMYEGSTSG